MSWICPHCDTAAIVNDKDIAKHSFQLKSGEHHFEYTTMGLTCPNPECSKATIWMSRERLASFAGQFLPASGTKMTWSVIPSTNKERAKPYPDYIPPSVLEDYKEACAIKDLSPKASATLSRRCLQGIIRDFWRIEADTLNKEILAIQDKVDPVVWDAIDSVRKVGNIGAHMEKNIDVIVDVSSDEADLLIEMIEMLIEDWYIARHRKQEKLKRIQEVAAEKAAARKIKPNEKADHS
ncbi:DUF4145 domain-containing protein [Enterobacter bugandensis]|uniref:DUF4145 domain-containing protein n=1 Tax=Enterobacter bugandensis TaxID=881260 RepID=UPI0020060577|nr:DUF4145 domain-containing protein [Enterobacter bugandensis]EKS6888016.1 DUF4145 domain-containing protein [Enterobacter bugandensis]EKS7120670.1 DUF4145 domain-containing protein [Enterobacter bugandensis]EMC1014619.1 DUF4145 domain-containing protein [Enterobacter bugandensis]MCK6954114.1 DUF4145 domain-containing protein [Enterobacter bugandensis]MCK7211046.1 DUF4145 domain-containing protein [Enterobacter bugandensis]